MTRYAPQWLQSGTYAASLDRRLIGALWPAPASSGAAVSAAGVGMDVHVDPGQVAVPSPNNTGTVLCTSDAIETVTLAPAPPAGTDRVDLIVCHPRSADLDGVSTDEDFIFEVVPGPEGAPPGAPPATPAGTVALARVHVAGGSASLTAANVTDLRPGGLGVGAAALPPPLAAGDPFRSMIDGTGEVWVAKGGVNGGAWKRAKDALEVYCQAVTVNAAAPAGFTGAATTDPYGLWTSGTGITAPIPGLYEVQTSFNTVPPANVRQIFGTIFNGAANVHCVTLLGASAIWYPSFSWVGRLAAGDRFNAGYTSGTGAQAANGNLRFRYVGP